MAHAVTDETGVVEVVVTVAADTEGVAAVDMVVVAADVMVAVVEAMVGVEEAMVVVVGMMGAEKVTRLLTQSRWRISLTARLRTKSPVTLGRYVVD